jgi:hypothetical protein
MYNKVYSIQKQSVLKYKIIDRLYTHINHRLSTDKNKAIFLIFWHLSIIHTPSNHIFKEVPFPSSGRR